MSLCPYLGHVEHYRACDTAKLQEPGPLLSIREWTPWKTGLQGGRTSTGPPDPTAAWEAQDREELFLGTGQLVHGAKEMCVTRRWPRSRLSCLPGPDLLF